MKKLVLLAAISLSICAANADTYNQFPGNRQMNMQSAEAAAINNAVNDLSNQKDAEIDIMDVIKEKPVVPAGTHKSSYSATTKGQKDPSGFGGTYLHESGVNDSKTIYKDDIGRLHFFGKGNVTKE